MKLKKREQRRVIVKPSPITCMHLQWPQNMEFLFLFLWLPYMVLTICWSITVNFIEDVFQQSTKYLQEIPNGLTVSIDNLSPCDVG